MAAGSHPTASNAIIRNVAIPLAFAVAGVAIAAAVWATRKVAKRVAGASSLSLGAASGKNGVLGGAGTTSTTVQKTSSQQTFHRLQSSGIKCRRSRCHSGRQEQESAGREGISRRHEIQCERNRLYISREVDGTFRDRRGKGWKLGKAGHDKSGTQTNDVQQMSRTWIEFKIDEMYKREAKENNPHLIKLVIDLKGQADLYTLQAMVVKTKISGDGIQSPEYILKNWSEIGAKWFDTNLTNGI